MSVHTYVMRHYVHPHPCYEAFVVMSVNMCIMSHLLCPPTRVLLGVFYVRQHVYHEPFVMSVHTRVMRHLLLCPSTRVL